AREEVGKAHLEFSRSVAEQAIVSGEPVMTVDARQDARFRDHRSVHAMKLRSVVAVPIPSPDGPVGALYVDNRLRPGRFESVDAELLMAFADQVAIALRNARLHESLRRQAEELDAERARVVALSQGQAEEIDRLQQRIVAQREVIARRYDYGALVARSAAMQPLLATLDRVIESPLTVLVQGESGSGKELVARSVHVHGPGKDGPFVAVNCAALPDTLLESELFGHVRGAFTGAERDRDGLMLSARGGTLFLDEVGEMSLTMQAKLLRVLEQREVRPVGGSRAIPVDFRLVCATNRDLRAESETGAFREDLYYRIGVVELVVPPLRDRVEDIPDLVRNILAQAAEEMDKPPPTVSRDAMHALMAQPWPGNVRQLANVLRAGLVMTDGRTLELDALTFQRPRPAPGPATSRAQRDARERARIVEALEATDWNVTLAAKRAGVSRATMYRKLERYGLR
ncbi:MAG: sigma 54-interacting transcriptional regulator, partial [Sandaracinaceae bacterium]